MVYHLILWDYADGLTEQQKKESGQKVKEGLEGLHGVIDGLVKIEVQLEPLRSSTCDLALISVFESEQALEAYQAHPAHQKVAQFVRSVTKNRKCIDYCSDDAL